MAKADKNIQTALDWLKKHGGETTDQGSLTKSLAAFEAKIKVVEDTKAQLKSAKDEAALARKEVGHALAATKAARKAAAKASVPEKPSAKTK